jgi:MinD-like ATPase involved in chromosome partitioning or flagellar assembly
MALICFASQKGSPGATLSALAVAAAWPNLAGRRKLLVEADPDGGVLAVRYRLGREPGLLSLVGAGRQGMSRNGLWTHTQRLPGGLPVVVASDRPEQTTAALTASGSVLGEWLQSLDDVDVIADVGRLGVSSPAIPFATAADLLLMVARPTAAQIQPGAERLDTLSRSTRHVGWCLIGTKPYSAAEIEDVHGIRVVGTLADDPNGAAALEAGTSQHRRVRSPLVRSAVSLAGAMADWLHPDAELVDHTDGIEPDGEVDEPDDTGSGATESEEAAEGIAPETPLASEAS